MRTLRRLTQVLMIASTMAAHGASVRAEAPSLDTCKKLQTEQAELERQGVAADLEKGPQWAKSNLPANRVTAILRYLQVYEQIAFRCEYVFAAYDAEEDARKAQAAARARALANIPPPPARKPAVPPPKTRVSSKTSLVATPPLPERRDAAKTVQPPAQPSARAVPATDRGNPTAAHKLWDNKTIDRTP